MRRRKREGKKEGSEEREKEKTIQKEKINNIKYKAGWERVKVKKTKKQREYKNKCEGKEKKEWVRLRKVGADKDDEKERFLHRETKVHSDQEN